MLKTMMAANSVTKYISVSLLTLLGVCLTSPFALAKIPVPVITPPGIQDIVQEIVVNGTDDRKVISKNSLVDSATVAIAKGAGLYTVCTGTTIGLSHVITAAHCVYDSKKKELKKDLSIVPALHMAGAYKPAPRFFMKKVYILKNYIKDIGYNGYTTYAASKDIAIIQVREFKGQKYFSEYTKRLAMKDYTTVPQAKEFSVIAYTGGGNNTKNNSQYVQHRGCRWLGKRYHYTAIKHDCDTTPSSSGMAMLAEFPDKRGYIVGIHTGSIDNASKLNSAAIFAPAVLKEIMEKVVLFKTDGLRHFQVFDAPKVTPKGAYVGYQFRNNCSRTVVARVIYKNIDGKQYMKGPIIIEPGQLQIFDAKTYDTKIRLNASLTSGGLLTRKHETYTIKGRKFSFQKMRFPNTFKDNEISFCK